MIKENALKYLGYLDNQVDSNTEILLNECLKELEQVTPKFMYQIYTLTHHPLTIKELNLTINYPDLIDLFDSCDRIVIIACTLGLQLDQQLRYYSKINLTKMTVMDALNVMNMKQSKILVNGPSVFVRDMVMFHSN